MPFEIKTPITSVDGLIEVFDQCDSVDEAIAAIEEATSEAKVEFTVDMAELMRARIAQSGTSVHHETIDAMILCLEDPADPVRAPEPLPPEPSVSTVADVVALTPATPRSPEISAMIERAMEIRAEDESTEGFGETIREFELLLTSPENFLFGVALNYGPEQCDDAYKAMMASGAHTTSCGDVSSFLFRTFADAEGASLTRYTSDDDPAGGSIKVITDELRGDGDQILRISLGPHSFLVEKRGSFAEGTCRVFQAYDSGGNQGGYSFAEAFERDQPIPTETFLNHLDVIMRAPYPLGHYRWAQFRDATNTIFHGTVDPERRPSSDYGPQKCIEVEVPARLKSLEEALESFGEVAKERAEEFHQFRENEFGLEAEAYHQSKWPESWGGSPY